MSQSPPLQPQQQLDSTDLSEPLMSTIDVLGWKVPEQLESIPAEEEAVAVIKANQSPYDQWRYEPTQNNLYNVVKSLQPTIQASLATMKGMDPNIKAKARVVAAKAVQSYDPNSGASLPTWVSSQLRQLTRDVRKSNNVLSVPENAQLDAYHIYKTELELEDELGRAPTVQEVADRAGMSIKKISTVKGKIKAVATDAGFESDDGSSIVQNSTNDYSSEAMDYVYNESDLKDQQLLEHLVGYGGSDIWDNKTIMEKLNLTPVQLSRRKMRLSQRIQSIMTDLETV